MLIIMTKKQVSKTSHLLQRSLPLALLPALIGAALRFMEIEAANRLFTDSAGRVAPADLAGALAGADHFLFRGLQLSAGLSLVLLFAVLLLRSKKVAELMLPAAITLSLGLGAWGASHYSALNGLMAEDLVGAVTLGESLSESAKVEVLEEANARYEAAYSDGRPVHSSGQLALLSGELQSNYTSAELARNVSALLALLTLILFVTKLFKGRDRVADPISA
jgi:hypothetical protein